LMSAHTLVEIGWLAGVLPCEAGARRKCRQALRVYRIS